MDNESVREFCLSLPHATERVQWGDDLLLCIGDKIFTVLALEPSHGVCLSFKCTPEAFGDLIENDGIVPAPYLARYHWVALEHFVALSDRDLKTAIKISYELVLAKLPRKTRALFEQK